MLRYAAGDDARVLVMDGAAVRADIPLPVITCGYGFDDGLSAFAAEFHMRLMPLCSIYWETLTNQLVNSMQLNS